MCENNAQSLNPANEELQRADLNVAQKIALNKKITD